jgi:hypothetical protein
MPNLLLSLNVKQLALSIDVPSRHLLEQSLCQIAGSCCACRMCVLAGFALVRPSRAVPISELEFEFSNPDTRSGGGNRGHFLEEKVAPQLLGSEAYAIASSV